MSHTRENYTVRDDCRERTRLRLLCYIGNAYFAQDFVVSGASKSPLALHTHNQADRPPMKPGTHVQASLLVTSTNHVKTQDVSLHPNNKHIDITKLQSDLHKLKRGERLKTPVRAGTTETTDGEDVKHTDVDQQPKELKGLSFHRRCDDEEEERDSEVLTRREKQLETFKRSSDYRFCTRLHWWLLSSTEC